MRHIEKMTAGGVTLAGLGALVGLAIGSGDGGAKLVAQRTQPVEVRTEVIRKTVNVYRREHPHHATGTGPGGRSSSGTPARGPSGVASAATRTRSSGTGAIAPRASATPVVSTRSSGSKGTSAPAPSGGSGSQTVKTRSSGASPSGGGSGGGSGSSRTVATRSSGGGGDNGGGHDD
jgi:hypothetical protein